MIPYFLAVILISISNILMWPISRLPDVSLPAFVGTAISGIGNAIASVHLIFPLFTAALIAAYVAKLAIENAHLIFKFIMWAKELVW